MNDCEAVGHFIESAASLARQMKLGDSLPFLRGLLILTEDRPEVGNLREVYARLTLADDQLELIAGAQMHLPLGTETMADDFSKAVKKALIERNLTVTELARELGWARNTVSMAINRPLFPTVRASIAAFLGVAARPATREHHEPADGLPYPAPSASDYSDPS